jgi:hypothetical protein
MFMAMYYYTVFHSMMRATANREITTGRGRSSAVPGQPKQYPAKLILNHPVVVDVVSQ